jgi:polyhydroxyalkanoate synthesis regulator phasin
MARTGNSADLIPKNLKALRTALEHSVTIQMAKLHEVVDDLVSRGSISRAEADKLVGHLVSSSKSYSHTLLQVVETVTAEARKNVEARVATAVAPVVTTAEKIADTVREAPKLVPGRQKPAKKPVQKPAKRAAKKSAGSRTTPSAKVQKLPTAEPIPGLADLTVTQVKPKLARLSAAELRRVRQAESEGKARKGVLAEIDRLLEK